jgi:hypothetical protein
MQIRRTIWNVQFVVVGVLWLLVGVSPLSKDDPRWYGALAASLIVSLFQLTSHRFMKIDVDFWERSRAIYENTKAASEKLRAEIDEGLKRSRAEFADFDHRQLEWKREANRYARANGLPLPYPSVDALHRPETKN